MPANQTTHTNKHLHFRSTVTDHDITLKQVTNKTMQLKNFQQLIISPWNRHHSPLPPLRPRTATNR